MYPMTRNLRVPSEQQNREGDARLQKIKDSIKNYGIIQLLKLD